MYLHTALKYKKFKEKIMALNKTKTIDKIEVVGEFKHIQVRERTDIVENSNVISSTYRRVSLASFGNNSRINGPASAPANKYPVI